jgi:hypothetical protein
MQERRLHVWVVAATTTCACHMQQPYLEAVCSALRIPRPMLQGHCRAHSHAAANEAWSCCPTGSCLV